MWLTDYLTEHGYNVEIIGSNCGINAIDNVNKNNKYSVIFPIKTTDMPLNLSSLASIVCLAGFLKQVYPDWFKDKEHVITEFDKIKTKEEAVVFIKRTIEELNG